jgi:hypothetical protein
LGCRFLKDKSADVCRRRAAGAMCKAFSGNRFGPMGPG